MFKDINWAGVILATIVNVALGFVWYAMVFEAQYTAIAQPTPEEVAAAASTTNMVLGVLNDLVVAIGLAWVVGKLGQNTLMGGARTGLIVGLLFACTTSAMSNFWAGLTMDLMPINLGYLIVVYTVMGAIVGGVRLPAKAA